MGAYTRTDGNVRRDIEELMERFFALGTKRRAPAGTLSGGQQQVLEIAIALLLHPRAGTAVLIVEQNAKQALAISHRGFVLELGRNRFEGTGRASWRIRTSGRTTRRLSILRSKACNFSEVR